MCSGPLKSTMLLSCPYDDGGSPLLRKWHWKDGVGGSSSARFPRLLALLIASSPSTPSAPFYSLNLEGNSGHTRVRLGGRRATASSAPQFSPQGRGPGSGARAVYSTYGCSLPIITLSPPAGSVQELICEPFSALVMEAGEATGHTG